jgi:hypothetical protein
LISLPIFYGSGCSSIQFQGGLIYAVAEETDEMSNDCLFGFYRYPIEFIARRLTVKYFASALFIVMLVGLATISVHDARGETASPEEMELVCQNWLSVVVQERGSWAGEVNPEIIRVQEITDDNGLIMARCYSISPRGYVIVPVLKEMPPVKVYSEESNYEVNQPGGVPQMMREVLSHRTKLFVELYGSLEASQPRDEQGMFDSQHRAEWDVFTLEQPAMDGRIFSGEAGAMSGVEPLLTSVWHQGGPYNQSCPMGDGGRTLVGCVATAAAQIMKYHEWPANGTGTSSFLWNGDTSCGGSSPGQQLTVDHTDAYDWANMPDHCSGGCPPAEDNALAELNYEVAVACQMNFGACASGALFSRMRAAFRDHFGYDNSIRVSYRSNYGASVWFSLLQEEINEGLPMVYGIYSHAIVCDGWRIVSSLKQYHMNYGWADGHTAWYTLDNLHCPWVGCDTMNESVNHNIIPPCVVLPSTVDFGDVALGCYQDESFIIINRNSGTLNGDVTETCDHYSILAGGGPFSLASGESLVVDVRFEPTSMGTHECAISTGAGDCGDVHCTGEGISQCTLQPQYLNFGSIALGDSTDIDFTIYNIGCTSLNGSITESCLHYEIAAGGGGYSLAPGDSLVVTVRCKPTLLGTWYCTIMTGSGCANISCEVIVYEPPPACLVEPDTLDFGAIEIGGFDMKTFNITNTGYGTLEGTLSESCTHFDIVSGSPYSLTHDQSQTVTILYFASTAGPHTCTIETGNAACVDVYCMGYGGTEPASCAVEPDTLDFGTVTIGDYDDLDFIITNTGGDTLSGTVSEVCTHYDIISGGGAYALAAGETVVVTVRFEPASSGLHTCTIETGSGLCTDVYCSGTGENPPICVVEPDTLDCGTVIVGDSLDMGFDIINAGGGILSGSVDDTCSCFDVVAGGGAYALSAEETLRVTVRFKPDADGSFECWVETGTADCIDVCSMGEGNDVSGLTILDAKRFFLYQNYPNPFNPATNIAFTVPAKAHTNLSIFNIEGRLVKTLVDSEFDGGLKTVSWDGRDARGNPVSSGVYFYRLRAGGDVMTKKMILLK